MKGISFEINIIENVTKVFNKINTKVASVNSLFKKTNSNIKVLPNSISGLNRKLDLLRQKQANAFTVKRIKHYRKELNKTERELKKLNKAASGGGLKNMFSGVGGKIAGLAGAYVGVNAITSGISSAFKAVGDYEQLNVAFTTMLGSAKQAKEVISDLTQFSNVTPFQPEQVNQAGKSLLAFGFTSQQLIPTLQQIGDISAGTGKDFNELTTIFGKAKIAGTLYAEDINQLIDAGIPIIEEFSKQLGVPASQVKKLASEGKISFDMLQTAFTNMTSEGGKFGGLMEAQSQTLAGRWSTLVGKFNQIKISIGEALMPVFEIFMKYAFKAVDWLSNMFKGLAAAINGTALEADKAHGIMKTAFNIASFIKENIGLIKTLVAIIASAVIAYKIWTATQWALNIAMDANPIGLIIIGVVTLVTAIVLLIKNMNKITTWFKNLGKGSKLAVGWLAKVVGSIFPAIKALFAFAFLIRKLIDNWSKISKKVVDVFNKIKSFFTALTAVISMIAQNIMIALQPVFAWIQRAVDNIKMFFVNVFTSIKEFVVNSIAAINNAINNIIAWFISLRDRVVNVFVSIKNFLISIFNKLKDTAFFRILIEPFIKLKDFVFGIFQSIFDFIKNKFSFIGRIAKNLGLNDIAKVFNANLNTSTTTTSTTSTTTTGTGGGFAGITDLFSKYKTPIQSNSDIAPDFSASNLPGLPSGNSPQVVGDVQGSGIKNINITIGSLVKEVTNYFRDTDTVEDADSFMTKLSGALQSVVNDVNYAV